MDVFKLVDKRGELHSFRQKTSIILGLYQIFSPRDLFQGIERTEI